jgi:hypothetical protein
VSRKAGTALAMLVSLLALWVGAASAGGGLLAPVQDRYERGEKATLVGYTQGPVPAEPFYAYLRPVGDGSLPALDDTGRYVGELVVRETTHGGYLRYRVSITFDVPANLPAGQYEVTYCDDPCTGQFLGDLLPSPLSIGVAPARPVVRMWAPEEPEIANLASGAVLVGPGYQTTAGALRAPPTTAAVPPGAPPAPAPVTTAPARVEDDGDMALGLPIALVLASAGATAMVLSRLQRAHRQVKGALVLR